METDAANQVKILLVDDHTVLRQALSEVLLSKGHYCIVGEASDGKELWENLKKVRPDLIVMDLMMPNVGGMTVLEEFKHRRVEIPVLVLSADEASRSVRAAMKAGARGFVPKHVGLAELEFAIQSILQGKLYISPSIADKLMGEDDGDGASALTVLSPREREILALIANGMPNREIGKMLFISTRTVDTHRSNILKKLKVKTNAELVKLAIGNGLISI